MKINFSESLADTRFGHHLFQAISDSIKGLNFKDPLEVEKTIDIVLETLKKSEPLDNHPMFQELSNNSNLQEGIRSLLEHLDDLDAKISISYIESSPNIFVPSNITDIMPINYQKELVRMVQENKLTKEEVEQAYTTLVTKIINSEIEELRTANPKQLVKDIAARATETDKTVKKHKATKEKLERQYKHMSASGLVEAFGSFERLQEIVKLFESHHKVERNYMEDGAICFEYKGEDDIQWKLMWGTDPAGTQLLSVRNLQTFQDAHFDSPCEKEKAAGMYGSVLTTPLSMRLDVETIYKILSESVAISEFLAYGAGYITAKQDYSEHEKIIASSKITQTSLLKDKVLDRAKLRKYVDEILAQVREEHQEGTGPEALFDLFQQMGVPGLFHAFQSNNFADPSAPVHPEYDSRSSSDLLDSPDDISSSSESELMPDDVYDLDSQHYLSHSNADSSPPSSPRPNQP